MEQTALHTPLTDLSLHHGGKLVPFAGYALPVQFPSGVMKEHEHTRASASLFDVSHMGQVWIDGPDWESVARAVETLVPQDVLHLADGRQRYGFFTNLQGGIEDDLMLARYGARLFLVVNAARKAEDIALMEAGLPAQIRVTLVTDRALVALQGPHAEAALGALNPAVSDMRFMDVAMLDLVGSPTYVSRSGYTGEDGFEISVHEDAAEALVTALLASGSVHLAGLGARDSLRLEAGLCLYGQDIDAKTTPVEAGLAWAIQKSRRGGGVRAGGYPGAQVIAAQIADGAGRMRVGLRPEGRAPVRAGAALFADEGCADPIGQVTSGGFGPTLGAPISMGYVRADHADIDTRIYAQVRGKALPLRVHPLPFVVKSFKKPQTTRNAT